MNSLFRRIKENDNLDSIQDSDDEEDFENNSEDKWLKGYRVRYFMLFK